MPIFTKCLFAHEYMRLSYSTDTHSSLVECHFVRQKKAGAELSLFGGEIILCTYSFNR